MKPFSPESLFTKHLSGATYSEKERSIILNVYCYFRRENPGMAKEDVIIRTTQATGTSRNTFVKIKASRKKGKHRAQDVIGEHCYFDGGSTKQQTTRSRSSRQCDEFVECAIRNKIHRDFFFKNQPPTLIKLHRAIREDPTLPNITKSTLHKILHRIGFVYRSRKRNSVLLERPDISEWRHRYLRAIKKYRREDRKIIYTDETWVNAGHVRSKIWVDTTVTSTKQAFLNGLSTGLKNPNAKGTRLIITHAGGRDGFVPGAAMIFQAKKDSGDYHGEMNAKCYEQWFQTQLLPNIPPHSVIVLDNAPYHSAHLELCPRKGWKKALIQEWLTRKGISWNKDMIIKELLLLVDPLRKEYSEKRIDKMAKEAGHDILRTPPYHCELNPIEMAWGQSKGFVAANNTTFKLDDVKDLFHKGLEEISVDNWHNYDNHVHKVEQQMWAKEGLIDSIHTTLVDPVVIFSGDDSPDESDDSDFEEEENEQ